MADQKPIGRTSLPHGPTRRAHQILLLFALLAIATSFIVPFGEPPDEAAHNAYIWYLRTTHTLPEQNTDPAQNLVYEGHQPPGYYAAVALLTAWAPAEIRFPNANPYLSEQGHDAQTAVLTEQHFLHPLTTTPESLAMALTVHLERLVSILMGITSVWLTYQAALIIIPEKPYLALFAAGIHAFIPMAVYISSAITNDNAAILIGSLMVWQMARLLKTPSARRFIFLGILIGLGILAKSNLVALLPAVAWTGWIAAGVGQPRAPTHRVRRWLGSMLLAGIPALLVPSWWFVRNQRLYGDPLAWGIRMVTNAHLARQESLSVAYVARFLWQQLSTFWGVFGWLTVRLPGWVYVGLLLLSLLGLAGFLIRWRRARPDRKPYLATVLLVIGGLFAATWIQGLNRDLSVASQGRFLFPGLSAIGIGLSLGWSSWLRDNARATRYGISGMFLLAASVLLFRLVPLHSHPVVPALPRTAQPAASTFGPWELVGWSAPRLQAGSQWPVSFYWTASRPLTEAEQTTPIYFFVHLVDAAGEPLAKWDGVPTDGRVPPQAWSTEKTVHDKVVLDLPDASQIETPRLAYLYVGVYTIRDGALVRTQVDTASPQTGDGTLILGPFIVRPSKGTRSPVGNRAQAVFGPAGAPTIALLGYDLTTGGDTWTVTLYWRGQAALTSDYKVFVHVANAGELIAQADATPCGGQCPTSLWQAGEVWKDEHIIVRPSSIGDDALSVLVGWYDPVTMARLPAFTPEGQRLDQDRVLLCSICR